jgi:hypothetical protein
MRIAEERLLARLVGLAPNGWVRIVPAVHADAPLGSGPSDSRFATRDGPFELLYAAEDFPIAFLETVVRDRFDDGAPMRLIDWVEIERRSWSLLTLVDGAEPLRAVDLTGDGVVALGVPTDVVRSRAHGAGRAFGAALFGGFPELEAIVFSSRFTERRVIAVRGGEPAARKLVATRGRPLADHPELEHALEAYEIRILTPR